MSSVSRRKFVKNSTSLLLGTSFLPIDVWGNKHSTPNNQMHLEVARVIKKKWGRKGLTLTLFYPKGSLGNIKPVVKKFIELTNVKIRLEEASLDQISSEMILKNRLSRKGGEFDIALPATFGLPDLVEARAIEDLTSYAREYEPPNFSQNSLYRLGDHFSGKFYGYQTDGDAYVMFYNKPWMDSAENQKKYFDQYGEKLKIAETWEELDQQIRFFHQPKKKQYGGSLFRNKNYIAWEFWIRFHAKGYLPLAADMSPQINNKAGREALEELIATSNYLEPGAEQNGLFENFKSFSEGNKFCNIGWGGTQKTLNGPKSKMRGKLYFSPTPGGVIKGKTYNIPYFNWGWNYVVSSTSKHKELSYLFTLFASTPYASTCAVREASGYFDPFRVEHYEDEKIQETYGRDFLKAHKKSLQGSIPDFYLRGQGLYLAALKQGVYLANQKKVGVQSALDDVASRWESITKRLGVEKQKKQWGFLKSQYPTTLKGVLK